MNNSGPIAAFADYVSAPILDALRKKAEPVPQVPGLAIVGGIPKEFADVLNPEALRFMVALYRQSLQFEPKLTLASLLQHRKMKRQCINQAALSLSSPAQLQNVKLQDGTVALGYRDDTRSIRENASWKVSAIPAAFNRFHDTITAGPTADSIAAAMNSGASFLMVDLEDSSTVELASLLHGLKNTTLANARKLDVTDEKGQRHAVLSDVNPAGLPLPVVSVRLEGLHLPNGHLLVDGFPVPAHLASFALYLFNNFRILQRTGRRVAFYLPKLERFEECAYYNLLFKTAEAMLRGEGLAANSISCVVIVENCLIIYELDEALYALRDYVCGLNTGWHDYVASTAAVHQCMSQYQMPPKSNLRVVIDYLEAYQTRIVQACHVRGAIPIGGMNSMNPPKQLANDASLAAKIETAFKNDFVTQTSRGLRGVWMSNPRLAPFVRSLVKDFESSNVGANALSSALKKRHSHAQLLLSDLPAMTVTEDDVTRNMSDALQYLASYLAGEGNVPITARMSDGTPVVLMEDAATLERSRRELRSMVAFNKPFKTADGRLVPLSGELAETLLKRTVQTIVHMGHDADVPYTGRTKVCFDVAFGAIKAMVNPPANQLPADYFTVLVLKNLLLPFLGDPASVERLESLDKYPFLKYPNVSPLARVEFTSNEAFAEAANLIKPHFPVFAPHNFAKSGQIYDGWETARHNIAPPDYTDIVLKESTVIHGVNIDTAHFNGNHGVGGSVEGLVVEQLDRQRSTTKWVTVVPPSLLNPNSRNFFPSVCTQPVIKVRLNMFPDGGISRCELYGEPKAFEMPSEAELEQRALEWIASIPKDTGFPANFQPNPLAFIRPPPKKAFGLKMDDDTKSAFEFPHLFDYLALDNGGTTVASSSSHYSLASNMIKAERGVNMGDGWETTRLRPDTNDGGKALFNLTGPVPNFNWTVFKLSSPTADIEKFVIDTLHYRNNPPMAFKLEACDDEKLDGDNYYAHSRKWDTIIAPTVLHPHEEKLITLPTGGKRYTHVLLKIFPCGGVSRVRLYGKQPANQPIRAKL